MTTTTSHVTTTLRYIRQNRALACSTLEQALVELITNCDDAFRNAIRPYDVHVLLNAQLQTCVVTDQACGIAHDQMLNKLVRLGEKSHKPGARGLFSRGAKDVSELGDVTFHSIVDNQIATILLRRDLSYDEHKPRPVTERDRQVLGIAENGFSCSLKVLDMHWPSNLQEFVSRFSETDSLVRLFSDPTRPIRYTVTEKNGSTVTGVFKYSFPPGQTETFEFPVYGYNTTALLTVTLTSEKLAPHQMGILICGDDGIYGRECFSAQIKANPYMRYVHGMLHCRKVRELMEEIDQNGDEDNAANPFPIIVATRKGLVPTHPFTQQLYSTPEVILKKILKDIRKRNPNPSNSEVDLNDTIRKVQLTGANIIRESDQFCFVRRAADKEDMEVDLIFDSLTTDVNIVDTHLYPHTTPVKVEISKEPTPDKSKHNKGQFDLSVDFTTDESEQAISYIRDNHHVMVTIHVNHPLVCDLLVLHPDGTVDGLDKPQGKMMTSILVSRALGKILVEQWVTENADASLIDLMVQEAQIEGQHSDLFARRLFNAITN